MTANEAYTILRFAVQHEIYDMLFWYANKSGPFLRDTDSDGELCCSVTCSDTFYWGCADDEPLAIEDLPALEKAVADCIAIEPVSGAIWGCELYAARRRHMRPQNCAYPTEPKLWPLFDACGPERPDDRTRRKGAGDA